jgi:CheY-like chemotaxis protein
VTRKLMIVDDNPEIITLYKAVFQRKGYDMLDAFDGINALEKLQDHLPDMFILDIMMPEMNGLELCQRIRALPEHAHTPVLILSAYSDPSLVERAFAAGANDYLIKPGNARNLEEKVHEMLEGAKIVR